MNAHRRFLVLLALRWFPVGLCIPIGVLLALSRGLTLAEFGLAMSLQGFVVLALELPTGGLSDSWGRRPVLALSAVVAIGSMSLLVVADSVAEFAVVGMLQGVYRALDSGPLESWYVDARLAADPSAKLERGLSAGGTVIGARDRRRRARHRRARGLGRPARGPDPGAGTPGALRAGRRARRDRRAGP